MHRYHDKAIQLRLKGRFMHFDPRDWDPDMDVAVAVGLGTGNRSRLTAAYRQILQIQQSVVAQLGQHSPVHLANIIYTCHKLAEAAGLESPERFFGTEEDARRAEQALLHAPAKPSAAQQKLELEKQKLQLDQRKAQAQLQTDAWTAQTEAARKAFETHSRLTLEQQKNAGQFALKAMQMQQEQERDAPHRNQNAATA